MKTKINYQVTMAVLLLLMVSGCTTQTVDIVKETADVQARSKAVTAREEAQDIQGSVAFYTDDGMVQMNGLPIVRGKKAIAELYHQLFSGENSIKSFTGGYTRIEVSAGGDMAFESGINRIVLKSPKGDLLDVGKYLLVWKKINGKWYVAAVCATSDAPAPVPLNASK